MAKSKEAFGLLSYKVVSGYLLSANCHCFLTLDPSNKLPSVGSGHCFKLRRQKRGLLWFYHSPRGKDIFSLHNWSVFKASEKCLDNIRKRFHYYTSSHFFLFPNVEKMRFFVVKYLHVLEHCLQTTFTKASTILYQATNHRAVFRDVTILVPSTWPTDPSYTAATTQVFSNSDIVLVPPPAPAPPRSNPGAGQLPGSSATPRRLDVSSTKAFAGCGLPGIRITMATDLLTNRALTPTFGAPGRCRLSTSLP